MEVVFCQLRCKNSALRRPPQIPVVCTALTELGLHASHVPRGFQPEAPSRGTARLNTSQREAHLGRLSPHARHSGGRTLCWDKCRSRTRTRQHWLCPPGRGRPRRRRDQGHVLISTQIKAKPRVCDLPAATGRACPFRRKGRVLTQKRCGARQWLECAPE